MPKAIFFFSRSCRSVSRGVKSAGVSMRRLHTDIVVELGVIATRKNPDRLVSRPEETKIPSNLVLINSLRFYIKCRKTNSIIKKRLLLSDADSASIYVTGNAASSTERERRFIMILRQNAKSDYSVHSMEPPQTKYALPPRRCCIALVAACS